MLILLAVTGLVRKTFTGEGFEYRENLIPTPSGQVIKQDGLVFGDRPDGPFLLPAMEYGAGKNGHEWKFVMINRNSNSAAISDIRYPYVPDFFISRRSLRGLVELFRKHTEAIREACTHNAALGERDFSGAGFSVTPGFPEIAPFSGIVKVTLYTDQNVEGEVLDHGLLLGTGEKKSFYVTDSRTCWPVEENVVASPTLDRTDFLLRYASLEALNRGMSWVRLQDDQGAIWEMPEGYIVGDKVTLTDKDSEAQIILYITKTPE